MGTPVAGPAEDRWGRPYRSVSLWFDQVAGSDPLTRRAPLAGPTEADVAVVGAGFTGLWTAFHLGRVAPHLRIVVIEAEIAGYGASGRNGGWCSALFPVGAAGLARRHGEAGALALRAAMRAAVRAVGDDAAAAGVACDHTVAGTITLARTGPQLARVRAAADGAPRWGDADEVWDAATVRDRLPARGVIGAGFTPDCATLQPARLARGLARYVEAAGVQIFEGTTAVGIVPGEVTTASAAGPGRVRADVVVRATEAWTATLPTSRRAVAPVYSLVLATEPLPAATWERIGLRPGEAFTHARHLVVYGQRTADDRLVFGGRGAPYHWRSRIAGDFDTAPRVHRGLEAALHDLFPVLRGHEVTHRWGGPLGIPRDWHAGVGLDRATGLGWAGGYVGDGVATSHLAGRTLADLVAGRETDATALPWVGHRSRPWEPEPLRWLGINAGLRAMTFADLEERLTGRPSLAARVMAPLVGHH